MVTIVAPTIHAPEDLGGGTLRFMVTYKLVLEANELLEFDHAARLWEEDGDFLGGDDDQITPYPFPERFRPGNQVTNQTLFILAARDAADTEVGEEEFKAQIWLRRSGSQGAADAEVFTNVIGFSA
jgi:hypothetical protein